MVGAVVGVQPFGGEGLSGTGPKAGGPLYLYRLLARPPADAMARALAAEQRRRVAAARAAARRCATLQRWAERDGEPCARGALRRLRRSVARRRRVAPRRADRRAQRLHPAAARRRALPRRRRRAIAWSSSPPCSPSAAARSGRADAAPLRARLPEPVRARIDLVADWTRADGTLRRGAPSRQRRRAASRRAPSLAERAGPIVGVEGLRPGETALPLERLVVERALSVNTAAAGGNATLMTLQ